MSYKALRIIHAFQQEYGDIGISRDSMKDLEYFVIKIWRDFSALIYSYFF